MSVPDEIDLRHEGVPVAMGELPSADAFASYEQVLPGAAERILAMLERQAAHRIRMEEDQVKGAARGERLGQLLGLAIVLVVFVVASRLIATDHELSGTVLAVCDLGVLASVYWRRRAPSATVS